MDKRYMSTRKQLDGLGYCESFNFECLPLVEKLTGDLIQTTRSLQHYMTLAKVTLKEKDALKCAAEPYICDNAKLVKENNQVHRQFITLKEEFDAYRKEATSKIRKLENNISNLEFDHRQLQNRCRERELKNLCADTFSSRSKCVSNFTRPCCSQRSKFERNPDEACSCSKKPCTNCPELENQNEFLTKKIDEFQDKNVKLSDTVAFLKCQVRNRDKENVRLSKLLEGGRPFSALQKDCCGKDLDRKLVEVCVELQEAETRANALACELKDSLDKQHEAMNRAIHLADRNTLLEKELSNIDRLALKVECECNNLLKEKCDIILNLDKQLESEKLKRRKFENELISMKEFQRSLEAELESNRNENAALNIALVSSTEMKEKLMKENDTLRENKTHRNTASSENFPLSGMDNVRSNSPRSTIKFSQNNQMFCEHSQTKTGCGCLNKEKTSKDDILLLLEKERKLYESQINDIRKQLADATKFECRFSDKSRECESCEKLKEERNFYYKKSFMSPPHENFILELKTKNCELEQQIQGLKKQNDFLSENNRSLKLCMEQVTSSQNKTAREPDLEMENYMQLAINKLERDLKRAHADIISLEEERNHLKCKLISFSASSLSREDRDHRKTPLQMRDYERMTTIIENLTRERDDLSERLKIMESDFLHVKSLNSQLKTLQLENDKNIAECQTYSYESKRELREAHDKIRLLEKCKDEFEHECQVLKSEKMTLRDNLSKIDQERDRLIMDIDDKTEKLSRLEHELRSKGTSNEMFENKVKELNKKMDLLTTSNASLEHKVRDSQTRNEAISIELQTISKQRDNALIENRRLQSDLAAVNNDLKALKREYDNSRKEVEQMKQQLQHYVDEVRRIEDILSRKEAERTDMLDHFASLSQEATVLENNNHSLENEAASKSIQLQTTMERLTELEKKLESRESLIDMQEAKMSALIYSISKLESELSQQKDLTSMAEKNLEYAREMCTTLEKQKKSILIGVGETDCEKKKLELHLKSLKDEKLKVEESYMKDRATVESLESLLNTSRREVVELKLQLQESLEETRQLKDKVEQLQSRLKKVEGESHSSRQRSEEAAKNLQELKWQINDQRFQRVRIADHQTSSKYCSGTL